MAKLSCRSLPESCISHRLKTGVKNNWVSQCLLVQKYDWICCAVKNSSTVGTVLPPAGSAHNACRMTHAPTGSSFSHVSCPSLNLLSIYHHWGSLNRVDFLLDLRAHSCKRISVVVWNFSFVHESLSNRLKLVFPIEQVIFQSAVTFVHLYTTLVWTGFWTTRRRYGRWRGTHARKCAHGGLERGGTETPNCFWRFQSMWHAGWFR